MDNKITREQIRNKLVTAIRNSNVKQADIARYLSIKSSTVAQYLSGRALPALDTLANLCIFLDIEPSDILCTKENEK